MANSPLRPPTLATFRSWGIQQELVICRDKITKIFLSYKDVLQISLGLFVIDWCLMVWVSKFYLCYNFYQGGMDRDGCFCPTFCFIFGYDKI
jgi:hypothetical protein